MFNRLFNTRAIRREKNYALLCQTFAEEKITTEEQIMQCRSAMFNNAKASVAIVFMIGVSLAAIFAKMAVFFLIITALIILSIIHSTHQGRTLALRYLKEVINAPSSALLPENANAETTLEMQE